MKKLKSFVEGDFFQNAILIIVILNSIILGLQTSPAIVHAIGKELEIIDSICLIIFIIEMILKMIVTKFFGYFKNGWNWFDFIIVLISVLSGAAVLSSFRVFRVFRVFRSLKSLKSLRSLRSLRGFKMVSSLKPLQNIIIAIGRSIPGMCWASLLLLVIYYIFSIIGVTLFGTEFPDWFGNIPKTMYTLFQVMTLESWSMGISRPVMEEFSFAWAYFVPFVLVSSFIMMNVIVGIVVNAISETAEIKKKEELEKSDIDAIQKEILSVREHLDNLEKMLESQKR